MQIFILRYKTISEDVLENNYPTYVIVISDNLEEAKMLAQHYLFSSDMNCEFVACEGQVSSDDPRVLGVF